MSIRTPTSKLLKDARNDVKDRAARATDLHDKIKWERRRAILEEEISTVQMLEEGKYLPKRVFISFSKSSGQRYFSDLENLLAEARFEVVTGFHDTMGTEGNILKTVLKQLARSTFYIGILTKEMEVREGRKSRWAPSVWISEEKGMALALEKPFLLLVDEEIHSDYWLKTTPANGHIFFNRESFEGRAKEAVERAEMRYMEYLLRAQKAWGGAL
jgi:hypothetical protein